MTWKKCENVDQWTGSYMFSQTGGLESIKSLEATVRDNMSYGSVPAVSDVPVFEISLLLYGSLTCYFAADLSLLLFFIRADDAGIQRPQLQYAGARFIVVETELEAESGRGLVGDKID